MKNVLLLLAVLVGFAVLIRRVIPTDIGERLSGVHERMMGRMMEHMPED
jgi:hypothetical protein